MTARAMPRLKPDHATFSMLLHSTTAGSDGKLIDRLPDVLNAMSAQRQQPNASVRDPRSLTWSFRGLPALTRVRVRTAAGVV